MVKKIHNNMSGEASMISKHARVNRRTRIFILGDKTYNKVFGIDQIMLS
jgi:hypothetical protein